jgi:Mce-associated membrane protein
MTARRWLMPGLVFCVLTALVVVDLLLVRSTRHEEDELSAQQTALARAEKLVPILLSYDYRTLDADLARARLTTTGDFRVDFDALLADVVRPKAASRKVTTSAVVADAGVISGTDERVDLLLFVTQTSTSLKRKTPSMTGSRLEVRLVKTSDGWLISALDPV